MDLVFAPLTKDQRRRLDDKGNRVWTEQEIRTMKSNLALHDRMRVVLTRRCGIKDCRYVIGAEKQSFALPHFSDVCEVCYYMHFALKNMLLRDQNYFQNLHDLWKKDGGDDWRKRDRLGL